MPALAHLAATAALAVVLAASAPRAPVTLTASETLLEGERPHLQVAGLAPGSEVTVESFRSSTVTLKTDGKWSPQNLTFHAQAQFWADAHGWVDLDRAAPVSGTYSGADPRGLLWSGAVVGRAPEPGLPADSPGLDTLADKHVRLQVRVGARVLATHDLRLTPWTEDVAFTPVDTPALVGMFAAPKGVRRAPTVILLHGSEGGDLASAKAAAGRWASHGYAAFALVYFAWPNAHLPNAPSLFSRLPVERIETARDWLSHRAEADVRRLGVAGGSKGGEYGLLAASTYPWIRAVVACVPSSINWGGFGGDLGGHTEAFTLGGRPVAHLPYGDYGPVMRGEITSAQRHQRDRAAVAPELVAQVVIPVERSRARLLLISGGRDAVWPSDAMSAEVVGRMRDHGQGARVEWLSDPDAGHFQCGTGDSPIRGPEASEADMGGGLVSADGRAPGRAWERTLAFMQSSLRPSSLLRLRMSRRLRRASSGS